MFNNLIESSSHGRELRRRGSFLLLTTASYALLFSIVGVVSIHAYDAHMEDQNLAIVTLLPPVLAAPPEEVRPPETPNNPGTTGRPVDVRPEAIAPIDHVVKPPDNISTSPNPVLPVRPKKPWEIGDHVSNAETGRIVGPGTPGSGSNLETSRIVTEIEPPPAPTPKPAPKVVRKEVINSEAISLPKPAYPPIAQAGRIQGPVNIQVLIDEQGKVISAKVISGSPLLARAALNAAYQARFSPTMLGEQPVKVSGVITYNFILQR